MSKSGSSGQYGTMPYSDLRQKYEITDMYESPLATRDYMRDTLKDLSCDATFFESDHKREDNHSEEFLSLRYSGHRSGEKPDAPDLFLELTDRDPRGTALDPDMRHVVNQSWERAGTYKFYNDADYSVTEREKRPQQLIQQIRDQFENIKAHLKIFSTSKDSFAAAGNYQQSVSSRADDVDKQTGIAERDEIYAAPKGNFTTSMSNNLPLGWEQTGDHEFKIASYGQIRATNNRMDSETNRADTSIDVKTTAFQDAVISAGVANIMKSVANSRAQRVQNGEWLPELSRDVVNSQYRLASNEQSRAADVTGDQTARESFAAVAKFIGALNRQSGVKNQDVEQQLQIIQFMDNATRAPNTSEARHRATDIVMSAQVASGFQSFRGVAPGVRRTDTSKRQTNETARRFESMQTARLGGSRMTAVGDKFGKTLTGEGYKSTSRARDNTQTKAPDIRHGYNTGETQLHETFSTADRSVRGLGSKFTRDKMDTDRTLNAISDAN